MKSIKKSLLFVLLLFGAACSKESESIVSSSNLISNTESLGVYEKHFSEILSKAIYDSEPMRSFIKNEAIKQFDNDFDVLYGMVKDKVVVEGRSFREILLQYCDSESQLEEIENALQLLNILVPDVSWLSSDGFSANNWDTEDNEIVVTYREGNCNNEYFGNGEVVCELDENQIPAFPFLVVKNNERMMVSGITRSGFTYEFKNDAYNGLLTKGGTHNYNGTVVPTMIGNSPTVTASQLRQLSRRAYDAYNEFGVNSSVACQRDYCYYQMTNDNLTNGILQRNVYEKLFRFKLNLNNIVNYDDDLGDPIKNKSIDTSFIYYKGNNDIEELTPDAVMATGLMELNTKFFEDGNLEIVINCVRQTSSGQTIQSPYYFTVQPGDLFEFNNVRFFYIHSSFWRKAKYTYVFDKNFIVSKWYYPETDIYFFNWSLGTNAVDYYLEISEQDSGDTVTTVDTFSFGFTTNITVSGNEEQKTSAGLGTTTTKGYQFSRSHQENSDLISRSIINYAEDFVLNRAISGNDTTFTLRNYDNNAISVCIIPSEMY